MHNMNNGHQGPGIATPALIAARTGISPSNKNKQRPDPRAARLIRELLTRNSKPIDRQELEVSVGAVNLPDLVMRVKRRYGVNIVTTFRKHCDRDGRSVDVGQYAITCDHAKAKARELLTRLNGEG